MTDFRYGHVSMEMRSMQTQLENVEHTRNETGCFSDDHESRHMPAVHRPQFAAMLRQICEGDTLVVPELSQLGSRAHDIGATIEVLLARGVRVIIFQLDQLDLGSEAGRLVVKMLALVTEMERNFLAERTRSGLALAQAQGKKLGRPARTTTEQRQEIIRQFADGASISALARCHGVSRASIMLIAKPVI